MPRAARHTLAVFAASLELIEVVVGSAMVVEVVRGWDNDPSWRNEIYCWPYWSLVHPIRVCGRDNTGRLGHMVFDQIDGLKQSIAFRC